MKFKLSTSNTFYDSGQKMNFLRSLGFDFTPYENRFYISDRVEPTIEFETLEEFAAFAKKCGYELIVKPWCDPIEIEIYDGYRE